MKKMRLSKLTGNGGCLPLADNSVIQLAKQGAMDRVMLLAEEIGSDHKTVLTGA